MVIIKTDIEELHNQLEAIKAEYITRIDQLDYDSKPSIAIRIEAYKAWVAQLGITLRDEEKTGVLEGIIKLNKDAFQRITYAIFQKDVPQYQRLYYIKNGFAKFFFQTEPAHVIPTEDDNVVIISIKSRVYPSVLIILCVLLIIFYLKPSIIWFCLFILNFNIILSNLVRDASGHELTHVVQYNVLRDIEKRLKLQSVMAFIFTLRSKIDLERSLSYIRKDPPDKKKLKLIIKDVFDQVENFLGRQIFSVNPEDAEFYYDRGNAYYSQNNFSQAISDYTKAIELKPRYAFAYGNRANAHKMLGSFLQAISDYTKVIEINPKDAESYSNRGVVNAEIGNMPQAITDCSKAIELNPKFAAAYLNRGCDYYKQNNLDQAISDYAKAIEINPNFAKAYNNRGSAYYKQSKFTEAILDFTQAIIINPKFAEAYTGRGVVYGKQGKFIPAINDFNKAIEIAPSNAYIYFNRGDVFNKLGNFSKAINDCNKATEINPNFAEAYFTRGFSYLNIKDYDNARADVHKAESLGYKPDKDGLDFLEKLKKISGE